MPPLLFRRGAAMTIYCYNRFKEDGVGPNIYHALKATFMSTGDSNRTHCGVDLPSSVIRVTEWPPKGMRKCKRCFRDLWDHIINSEAGRS